MTDELDLIWQRLEAQNENRKSSAKMSEVSRAETLREAKQLEDTAREFYKLDQFDSALQLYQKACELATQADDDSKRAEYLSKEGHVLYRLRRYTEALACLVELEGIQANPIEHWHGLINQIGIACSIPISLRNIEKLIRRCRDEIKVLGLQQSYSMLLVNEAILAYLRHDSSTELAKAQEAMSTYDEDAYPKYDIHVLYYPLIDALIRKGDIINALHWLEKYEGVATTHERYKENNILGMRTKIAFLEGDCGKAWNYARRRLQLMREGDAHPYEGLKQYTKMAISCGYLTEASHALVELLSYHRQSECGHIRYRVRCLVGDYYYAMAKHIEATLPDGEALADKYRRIAKTFYGHAGKVGEFIDRRLCCDWHGKEIKARLDALNERR